jgi:pimeloyl-ACP methyl ester carboxylesterase
MSFQSTSERYPAHVDRCLSDAWIVGGESMSDENRAIYLRAYARPQALLSTIGWYRDYRLACRRSIAENSRNLIGMPVLAIGGEYAGGSAPAECMRQLARDVHGVEIAGSGHHLAEEAPGELAQLLIEHFRPR